MKYTQIPEKQDTVVEVLSNHGHTYTDDVNEAEFIIFNAAPEELPDPLPKSVQFIQTQLAGVDALVTSGVMERSQVRWANAAGLYDDTVAESALALLLAVNHQHKVAAVHNTWDIREKVEAQTRFLFRDQTVAVIGAGGIGRKVIELANAFGARTVAVNRSGNDVPGADETHPLKEAEHVWESADAFVLLTPLTAQTHQLVDRTKLEKMKDTAVVVNVGRGPLVDTDALVEALVDKRIAGAGLDVTDPEPLPDGHPLWGMDNVVITPHTANTGWYMQETIGELAARNAEAFARGEKMPTEVDVEAGY
ncbi:hypothetical protein DF222_02375 [Corynebacterium yudongzhengii]|uniref:D-isomer specific 2-hydroxyacid dehydrogenase NAD-binding domain-containing protein n=1 Tax=Corynebacterium yudongzhengii TaxID=2080740 RepID=A0A2U1T917_9CORY|nr:D-isomer specific 2-hydroxyacid dehydrogenase family protein [Corynebacterium yudongzhengii]PWC02496.1 hypothetical protein DF222_02375 [Corynebacterium yudongzhengii]